MKRSKSHSGLIVAAFLAFFATSIPRSTEYLDPGTGSYVFQVVVGTVLGAAVAVKMGWRRMWGAVSRKSSKSRSGRSPRAIRSLPRAITKRTTDLRGSSPARSGTPTGSSSRGTGGSCAR